jgi:hypothetical protein
MKKIIFAFSALALIGAFVFSCKKPEPEKVVLNAPVISAEMSGDAVSVSWNPVTNATGYKVEYKKASDAEFALAGSPTYGPFLVTGFDFGNTYEFRVKATCGEVESPYSNVVSVEVAKYLSKPVIAVTPGIGFLNVEWQAVEGAASYQVEYKLALASEYTVGYTGDETSYKITSLESGVAYDVRVGVIAEGYSMSYSDVTTISTTAAPSTIIANADQLIAWLGSISGETTDVAALTADIDMTGKTITSAPGFFGELQGQGFAIKNLQSSVPLFAVNNGRITDLVIDESCVFTVGCNIFGTLVGEDGHGTYENVKNKANVTYTASADVNSELIIGGLVGKSDGGSFKNCSNSGAVKIEAPGHKHQAVGLGGLVGFAESAVFEGCINRGPVSLTADYGDPRTSLSGYNPNNGGGGINVGGILGGGYDYGSAYFCTFKECENEAAGAITVSHTKIDALASVDNSGYMAAGGILGRARGNMKNCKNFAPVNVTATTSDRASIKLRNFCIEVGGMAGLGLWAISFESCSNNGNIDVVYDGKYNGNRNRSSVGGICGWQDYDAADASEGEADIFGYYCKQRGNITVNSNGVVAVGGIFGFSGKQIGNTVYDSCTITYSGTQGYVGGLVGVVQDNPESYSIKSSSCAATIIAEDIDGVDDKYFTVGGLIGGWCRTSANQSWSCLTARDGKPCSFSGSVSSTTISRVGTVVGYIATPSGTLRFGDADNKIPVSGTFAKKDVPAVAISSENVETYAIGADEGVEVAMNVEYAAPAAE